MYFIKTRWEIRECVYIRLSQTHFDSSKSIIISKFVFHNEFRDIHSALITLFMVFTLDHWVALVMEMISVPVLSTPVCYIYVIFWLFISISFHNVVVGFMGGCGYMHGRLVLSSYQMSHDWLRICLECILSIHLNLICLHLYNNFIHCAVGLWVFEAKKFQGIRRKMSKEVEDHELHTKAEDTILHRYPAASPWLPGPN